MPDPAHVALLDRGVDTWNAWRDTALDVIPDLSGVVRSGAKLAGAHLSEANLSNAVLRDADLSKARLFGANLSHATLSGSTLIGADLRNANLAETNLSDADLSRANLDDANLIGAHLRRARLGMACLRVESFMNADLSEALLMEAHLDGVDLSGAKLRNAYLTKADLSESGLAGADLTGAHMNGAYLMSAYLPKADLSGADLSASYLAHADLSGANLTGADLQEALLVDANLDGAHLTGARVYGTAVWTIKGTPADQGSLVITRDNEPPVTVDDLKVAQFIHVLLEDPDLRHVIDTIGQTGVLILGRFGQRKPILDALRDRIRQLGFVPIVFDFEKPSSKDFTETVKTLAGMSAFVVADITAPRSVPQEAQATIPDYMIPFVPIIESGERPWAMFQDLWIKYRDWVLEPLEYPSIDALIPKLGSAVVKPALERRKVLLARRAEEMGTRFLDDFDPDEQ